MDVQLKLDACCADRLMHQFADYEGQKHCSPLSSRQFDGSQIDDIIDTQQKDGRNQMPTAITTSDPIHKTKNFGFIRPSSSQNFLSRLAWRVCYKFVKTNKNLIDEFVA